MAQSKVNQASLIQTEIQTNVGPKKVYQLSYYNQSINWKFTQHFYKTHKTNFEVIINNNDDLDYSFLWRNVKLKKLKGGPFTIITGGRKYCESSIIVFDKNGKDILNPKNNLNINQFKAIGNRKEILTGLNLYKFFNETEIEYRKHPDFIDSNQTKIDPEYRSFEIALKDTTVVLRKLMFYEFNTHLRATEYMTELFGPSNYSVNVNPCLFESHEVWTSIKYPIFDNGKYTIIAGGERDRWSSIAMIDSLGRDVFGKNYELREDFTFHFIQKLRTFNRPWEKENPIEYNTGINKDAITIDDQVVEANRFQISTYNGYASRFFSKILFSRKGKWHQFILNDESHSEAYFIWNNINFGPFEDKFTVVSGGRLNCEGSIVILDQNLKDVLGINHPLRTKMLQYLSHLPDDQENYFYDGHFYQAESEATRMASGRPFNKNYGLQKIALPIDYKRKVYTRLTFYNLNTALSSIFFMILHNGKWDAEVSSAICSFQSYYRWTNITFPKITEGEYTVYASGDYDAWSSLFIIDKNGNDIFAEDTPLRKKFIKYFRKSLANVDMNKAGRKWTRYTNIDARNN